MKTLYQLIDNFYALAQTKPAKNKPIQSKPVRPVLKKQEPYFPSPAKVLNKEELFEHYRSLAEKIKTIQPHYFSPNMIVLQSQRGDKDAAIPSYMIEGGEGVGLSGLTTTPALLFRFCDLGMFNPDSQKQILNNKINYVKSILNQAGVLTSNYLIQSVDSSDVRTTIRSSAYNNYVMVALDMNEDKQPDEG